VLPHFAKINSGGPAGDSAVHVPPPHFQLPLLPIKAAFPENWTHVTTGLTASQKAGLRYEKKVQFILREQYGIRYHANQVIRFVDQRGGGCCVPDGLIRLEDRTIIVEIKSQHMPESWWQLRKKYEPVIRVAFPSRSIVLLLEICRSLDVDMPYPEKFTFVSSISDWTREAKDGDLGVMKWKL
jgi:hypothetical protein